MREAVSADRDEVSRDRLRWRLHEPAAAPTKQTLMVRSRQHTDADELAAAREDAVKQAPALLISDIEGRIRTEFNGSTWRGGKRADWLPSS